MNYKIIDNMNCSCKPKIDVPLKGKCPEIQLEFIKDKYGKPLLAFLKEINHIYIPYRGTPSLTRKSIDYIYRRKGLWVTWVKEGKEIITEVYIGNDFSDCEIIKDSNWKTLDDFIKEIIKNEFEDPDFLVWLKELIRELLKEVGGGSVNPEDVITIVSQYLTDQLVTLGWNELNNYINKFVDTNFDTYIKKWLQDNTDYLFNLIKDKITQEFDTLINNKFEEFLTSQEFIDAVTNIVNQGSTIDPDQIKEIVKEAIKEAMAEQERVIANALARHEQEIILLKNNT